MILWLEGGRVSFYRITRSGQRVVESFGYWQRRGERLFVHFRCTSGVPYRDVLFDFDAASQHWVSFDGRIRRTMRYRGALAVEENDEAIIHHHMQSLCASLGNEPSQLGAIELMRSTEPLRVEPIPTTILALGDAAERERHVETLDGVLVEFEALAVENDVNEEDYVFVDQDLAQYDDV